MDNRQEPRLAVIRKGIIRIVDRINTDDVHIGSFVWQADNKVFIFATRPDRFCLTMRQCHEIASLLDELNPS